MPANRCWSEWAKGNGDLLSFGCDIFTDEIFLPAQIFCVCFYLWYLKKNNSFTIIFSAFCLSLSGRVMSEKSVQSWLNFCYNCCVRMWWGVGTGEWVSSQGQAGTDREEAESSCFQPHHPPQQGMSYPAHQPCLSNHSILLVKRQEKKKNTGKRKMFSVRDLGEVSEDLFSNYPKIIPFHPLLLVLSGKII